MGVAVDRLRTARAQNVLYGPGSAQGLQAAEAAPNGGYVCGWPRRLDLHRDRHQVLMRRRASLRDSLTRGLRSEGASGSGSRAERRLRVRVATATRPAP